MNDNGTHSSEPVQGKPARKPRRRIPQIGFCIDVDNAVRWNKAFGSINVTALARLLDHRGVAKDARVACGHHFSPAEALVWAEAGFYVYCCHENADDLVCQQVERFANRSLDQVLIGTGDHYACDLVRSLSSRGIEVHILARSDACSGELRRLVGSNYAWLDSIVSPPQLPATLH